MLAIRKYDTYFVCKQHCIGTIGVSSIQKCTAAMRMLAYGAPADTQDGYMRMDECTTIDCMYWFCKEVMAVIRESLTTEDTAA